MRVSNARVRHAQSNMTPPRMIGIVSQPTRCRCRSATATSSLEGGVEAASTLYCCCCCSWRARTASIRLAYIPSNAAKPRVLPPTKRIASILPSVDISVPGEPPRTSHALVANRPSARAVSSPEPTPPRTASALSPKSNSVQPVMASAHSALRTTRRSLPQSNAPARDEHDVI